MLWVDERTLYCLTVKLGPLYLGKRAEFESHRTDSCHWNLPEEHSMAKKQFY